MLYLRLVGNVKLYELDDPSDSSQIEATHIDGGDQAPDPKVKESEGRVDNTPVSETHFEDISKPKEKISKLGELHITIWAHTGASSNSQERNWIVGIKAEDVKLVPLLNQLFDRTAVGSPWLKFTEFGMYVFSSFQ